MRISKYDAAKMEKCENAVFFKGGVGNARRADRLNRHFVGVGHAPTAKAEHVLQDDLTEALKGTQHRSQIWLTHSRKMGQDCLKMWQHRPHTVSKRERERERETETEKTQTEKTETATETNRDRDGDGDRDRQREERERERERDRTQPYTDPSGPAPGCQA